MGPASRELLDGLADVDLGKDAFPFGTSRDFSIGGIPIRGLRTTYVGEIGWELYIPTDQMQEVYDSIVKAGCEVGLRHCGFRSMLSCRIEKGYRHWGHDIGPDDTPLEAGLAFAVAWDKDADFVGREALERARRRPSTRRMLHFLIEDEEAMLHHDEPIWRNGVRLGLVTSGAWGYSLGGTVGLGWVQSSGEEINADWVRSADWEIEIAGRRFSAQGALRGFYDPRSKRVRG
jgi:4-methylaminobutanoate oxidase (formaldehyde-forming)